MATEEEKKFDSDNTNGCANPQEEQQQTQALIKALYSISKSEFMTPSVGNAYSAPRDPHLRLRRTLTPSLNVGIPKYAEAQFMLSKTETSGKRLTLEFGVEFNGTKKYFTMHGYAFGASESEADVRVVTLHGISPGVSRTRWHKLGARYNEMSKSDSFPAGKKVRFVALDWHSIDRSVDDVTNTEYLTCLPKHMMEVSSNKEEVEEILGMFPPEIGEKSRKLVKALGAGICPRTFEDGGRILRAVIEEGLGWGTKDKPLILGVKSWSGGLGMRMLAQVHRSRGTNKDGAGKEGTSFADNIQGAIIMHPGCFDRSDIADAMSSGIIPTALMCWAKDDPLVPYPVSQMYLDAAKSNAGNETKVKLMTYESGGHHNFDGTGGLPNFDDEVISWINGLP